MLNFHSQGKHILLLVCFSPLFFASCGSEGNEEQSNNTTTATNQQETSENEASSTIDALADPLSIKGVGPVTELDLEPTINQQLAQEGKAVFEQYCTACHKIEERYIGPALKEVTTRRSPEWIMNMILNPEQMVKEDPIAKELLKEYLSPMANQGLTQEQARSILEYFRTLSEVDSLNHQS